VNQILRRVFQNTSEDKDFSPSGESKFDVDPLSGEEVKKIVARLFKIEPALIAKMAEILK
jgi:hypothetical protein